MSTVYEWMSKIRRVEERFSRAYNAAKMADAKVESQAEYDEVSTGWWVVLDGWPIAIRIGGEKPTDLAEGDTISVTMRKCTIVGQPRARAPTTAELMQLAILSKRSPYLLPFDEVSIGGLEGLRSMGLVEVSKVDGGPSGPNYHVSITPRGVEAVAPYVTSPAITSSNSTKETDAK